MDRYSPGAQPRSESEVQTNERWPLGDYRVTVQVTDADGKLVSAEAEFLGNSFALGGAVDVFFGVSGLLE